MKFSRWLAAFTLFLVAGAATIWRAAPRGTLFVPGHHAVVYLVEKMTLEEALSNRAVGAMPSRAGRVGESWSLEDTLRTGSRSPVPPDAPRWLGKLYRVAALAQVPMARPSERVFAIGLPRNPGLPALIPIVVRSDSYPAPSLLISPSTHQPGLIAATDLATTLAGKPIGAGQEVRLLRADVNSLPGRVALWESQHRAMRFLKFVPWALAAILLVGLWRRWTWASRFALAYPLGLLLVPMLGLREGWIYLGAALVAAGFAALGKQGIRGAAWLTVGLMALDQLLGGWVSARTPLSYSPLEAARFYGIGNEAGGYLIGAALVACAGDLISTVLLGVAVSALLGAPMLGANFGCFLASVVGFSVAVFCQVRRERRALTVAALAALALLGVFLVVRGSSGTHVGRASGGDGQGRGAIVARKLSMNAHLTLTSPWAMLALVQLILLWRQKKISALLAGAGGAWLLNDSGIVAGALLLLWHQKDPGATAPGSSGLSDA